MNILVILLLALLLFRLEQVIYARYWNHNLTVDLRFSGRHVEEGNTVRLEEVLTSRKWLPLPWLSLKLQVSRFLEFPDDRFTTISDASYREELFSIGMFQQIRRQHTLTCRKRGYYTIRTVDFVSSDLLLTLKLGMQQRSDVALYVLPRPVPRPDLDAPLRRISGEQEVRRHHVDDPFVFRGIREYLPSDPMRSVNWKATARTGGLMVNVAGYTSTRSVELVLNLEYPSVWSEELLLEDSIRIASTLADHLIADGFAVSFNTNGRDTVTRTPPRMPPGSSHDHFTSLQETLARLDLRQKGQPFARLLQECIQDRSDAPLLVVISPAYSQDIRAVFSDLEDRRIPALWVLPVIPADLPQLPDELLRDHRVILREVLA